ncbi:DUF4132 domain-containing protein [Actinoplanes sp. NPDC051470]|uniref:DUF4132 domain-containing protein n=1 Tax=Actinoplanes sp. NPDC051470 TaxID=3157224 RepID=UPI00343B8011
MRSFEFIEGGSAKFWEIWRDGSDVGVRFGRVGTNGQTKIKTFDDTGAAEAHETRLIGEKLRKGYAETSASADPAVPAPATEPPAASEPAAPESVAPAASEPAAAAHAASAPAVPASAVAAAAAPAVDEDTFVFPAAWHRHRIARRGGHGVGRFVPDPKARATVSELSGRFRESALDVESSAARVAAVSLNWQDRERAGAFADDWIARHGLRFAAEAAVRAMSVVVTDAAVPVVREMRAGDTRHSHWIDGPMLVAFRVRHALASASDEEYAEVVAALTAYRTGHVYARAATSVLAPTQTGWVEEDIAAAVHDHDTYLAMFLLAAVGTKAQLVALLPEARFWPVVGTLALPTTLADALGPDLAFALFSWFAEEYADSDAKRRILTVLAALPGDEVMRGLIERADQKFVAPALTDAAARFPARALRWLAEGAGNRTVADLLRAHVLAHPDLVERVRPELSPAAAARVEAITSAGAVAEAPAGAVPRLLADPPWRNRPKAVKPAVVAGLECTDPPAIHWLDGERDEWLREPDHYHRGREGSWADIAGRMLAGRSDWSEQRLFIAEAPDAIARPTIAKWWPRETWDAASWMRIAVARFEIDALAAALAVARRSPTDAKDVLLPYAAAEVAPVMADWWARLKSVRGIALAWLLRHPVTAARALVPAALQKPGLARRQAENALFALHGNGHTEAVRTAAAGHGDEAAAAIETLLAMDPTSVMPARLPPVPAWAVPGLLPPVLLRDGSGALPADAVTGLVQMLAMSRLDDAYAGVEAVAADLDPASLAEFAWGVFQRWQNFGATSKENWVLDALGLVGDDETVRRLTPLILAWPGEGGHAKAVTGVSVLAAIGTDVALMHLHGIAQRAKFRGLKTAAGEKMDEVAAALGLTAEQLADRLVPDFGLAADGSMTLDYGSRRFTVGFDEQLRPYVADAAGKHLKALPKPGVKDDAELAPAAYKAFAALKKDVRTVAADQLRRLERAMVTGRRWSGGDFRRLFVEHPLVWHIVRRLVWGRYDGSGALIGAVRVAEDRSFSTVDDDQTELADDAIVGVVHPLELGDALAGWAEVFADYEILQPFPQLGRSTFALTPAEANAGRLSRFEGATVPTGKVIGLERRGWKREEPQDGGHQGYIELAMTSDRAVVVSLDPGIAIGAIDIFPEQKLDEIFLSDGSDRWYRRGGRLPLETLDRIAVSEVIRDLTEVTT